MIEIMKEGDKLSKTASKNLRPEDINIAHLIRERVEQIRRYEMLRDNKELLEQITFTTSNPTSRCIDTDFDDDDTTSAAALSDADQYKYNRARSAEFNLDDDDEEEEEGDDDDLLDVTEPEEELIALISGQAKLKDEMLMKGMKFGGKARDEGLAVAAVGAGGLGERTRAVATGAKAPAAGVKVLAVCAYLMCVHFVLTRCGGGIPARQSPTKVWAGNKEIPTQSINRKYVK